MDQKVIKIESTKPIKVGLFGLGMRKVLLTLRPGEGRGAWFSTFNDDGIAEIAVGVDKDSDWPGLCGALLHEATELAYTEMGLRYGNAPDFSNDTGNYLFSMTHTQFSEATARVGVFMSFALVEFSTAVTKYQKGKPKPRKRKRK